MYLCLYIRAYEHMCVHCCCRQQHKCCNNCCMNKCVWLGFCPHCTLNLIITPCPNHNKCCTCGVCRMCSSYPKLLIVPRSVTDGELEEVAKFRVNGRIPVVVWR